MVAPTDIRVIFATMVTLAQGKSASDYVRMTVNWVRQLEYHGIPRSQQLILVTDDVDPDTLDRVKALNTIVKLMPPLRVVTSNLDRSYHNQPSKLWLFNLTEYDKVSSKSVSSFPLFSFSPVSRTRCMCLWCNAHQLRDVLPREESRSHPEVSGTSRGNSEADS
jgi:hypothetical protein